VLYSAYVSDAFAVPAAIAQADAIVSKNAPVGMLLDAVDAVAAGESDVRTPDAEAMEAASARVMADDLPILGMLFAKIPVGQIAATLGLDEREVRARALRIIGEMQAHDRRHGHAAAPAPAGARRSLSRRALVGWPPWPSERSIS
jgi:DNA-binding NarL/FixJ family response regulator